MGARIGAVLATLLLCPIVAAAPPSPRPPLAEREAVPGRLRVRVFGHELPGPGAPVPCWLYATDGFRRLGRSEMVFAVLRRAREDPSAFPEDPVALFARIFRRAPTTVTEGGHSAIDAERFLGRSDLRGVVYTRLDPLRSALLQPSALLVVPLTGPELETAVRFGILRVLGLLGTHHRLFPWPGFFDRERPSLCPPPDDWDTVLRKARVARLPGVRVAVEVPASASPVIGQGTLVVSLPAASREALAEAVAGQGEVALTAELDPEADALAVYRPGQKTPFALRAGEAPVARMAGTFVAFLPAASADTAKLLEDGFAVQLTADSRRALDQAFTEGRDLQLLGAPGSMAIKIRWRD
jgi:hypothetical protein